MQRDFPRQAALCPNWQFNFYSLSVLHCLWLTRGFLALALPTAAVDFSTLFHVTAWLCYGLLYMTPVPLLGRAAERLLPAGSALPPLLVLATSAAILIALQADLLLYQLYEFHLNGFVWNVLTTPGGLESLGSSASTYRSVAVLISTTLTLQVLNLLASRRGLLFCLQHVRTWRWALTLGSVLFLTQGIVYGISDLQHRGDVLDNSKAYPLFQRVRIRSLAGRLGVNTAPATSNSLQQSRAALRYPLAAPRFAPPSPPLNIVLLVAESLRWDQLTPETMPNTWQFAAQNLHFTRHYSSGNGTREALFGLFYGLYGSYWEAFLHARQSPLVLDRLQELGYQLDLRTSAAFTYPEFDKTVFSKVPPQSLHEEGDELPAWQRDQANMNALLDFLQKRNRTQPFFSFFFLESTHASYSFPEGQALLPDYSRNVDFTQLHKLDTRTDAGPLLARYRNAGHWIDAQLGRLYQALAEQGLLESTLVIVTGDHGEEFMETGRWGHNSTFVEEQTHVPLVVHYPGRPAARREELSSHLDIASLLLQTLGLQSALAEVSQGRNLLEEGGSGPVVLSDWHSLAVLTPALKYRISYLATTAERWQPTAADDTALDEDTAARLLSEQRGAILGAMQGFTAFRARE